MLSRAVQLTLRSGAPISKACFARTYCNAVRDEVKGLSSAEWKERWIAEAAKIKSDISYDESSQQLRKIIKGGLLRFTDLRDNPERFFEAHRLLANHSPDIGPGFFIRFTVQYNLFAGTILGMASPEQLKILDEMQDAGTLGCFGLTEKLAGVNSGLVINTKAVWNQEKQCFIINSPDLGADKNWISQGYVADKALVFAELTVDGASRGGQAFVMDMRKDGKLTQGVEITDMGRKTVGNDLDNASIHFKDVELPKSALLSRFAEINDAGEYVSKSKALPMQMIGQRLFTGRVAVGQGALAYTRELYKKTKNYSDNKKCWSPTGNPVLSEIPQLKALYKEFEDKDAEITAFADKCEVELNKILVADQLPPPALIEAIACIKVLCVEQSIEYSFKLKQEVGSYALMSGAGFEQMDFLQCCKFAEGDSRILMQKMARDRFREFSKGKGSKLSAEEIKECETIQASIKAEGGNMAKGWDAAWENTYALARASMKRVVSEFKAI